MECDGQLSPIDQSQLECRVTTNDKISFTHKELIEILDTYTIDQLNEFYYGLFDKPTKAALKPYFLQRMKSHLGL